MRNHIQPADIKHWAKHWNVTPDQIRQAIEKIVTSATAVRKELALQKILAEEDLPGRSPSPH